MVDKHIDYVKLNKTKWAIGTKDAYLINEDGSLFWTTDIRRAKSLALQYGGCITDAAKVMADLMSKAREEVKKDITPLSYEDSKTFIDTLLNPPAPNKALKSAAKRYQRQVKKEKCIAGKPKGRSKH